MDKQEVFSMVQKLFIDLFELDPEDVHLEASLYEDLDVDSIDAVDLVVELKNETGLKVDPEDFKNIVTVGDVVNAVHAKMNENK